MNVGFDIAFPDATKYYAFETVEINSIQYAGKINPAQSSTSFKTVLSVDGDYQPSNMTIAIDNENRSFYTIINSATNKYIYGVQVTLRDTSNNVIWIKFIESWVFDTVNENIIINISDFYGDINSKIPKDTITEEEYPNVNPDAIGLPVPHYVGHFDDGALTDKNYVKAWYVELDATNEYLIGVAGVASGGGANTITMVRVETPGGVNVTGLSAFNQHTDGRWYVDYADTVEDYLKVNFTYDDVAPTAMFTDISDWLTDYTFDVSEVTGLIDNDLSPRGYNDTPLAYVHYGIIEEKTGRDVLSDICQNFTMEYYLDAAKAAVFKILDASNAVALTLNETKVLSFQYGEEKTDDIYNRFKINCLYNYLDSSQEVSITYNKQESIDDNNITKVKDIDTQFFMHDQFAGGMPTIFHPFTTAKYYGMYHSRDAWITAAILVDLDVVTGNSLNPGDIIKFSHQKARTTAQRKYRIQSIEWSFHNDKAIIELRDVDFIDSIRTADKLLVQSNTFNGSRWLWDEAPGGDGRTLPNTTIAHSTAQTKFSNSSLLFVRANPDAILIRDNYNFTDQTNATIDCLVRLVSNGNQMAICNEYDDANNFYYLRIDAANTLRFRLFSGGMVAVGVAGGTALAINTWYHIALIKVGDDYGIYLDGAQDGFVNDNSTATLSGTLFYLGTHANTIDFLDAYMASFRFSYDNVYGAAPVVGLTDTITVPTRMLRDTGF